MSERENASDARGTTITFVVEEGNRRLDKVIRDRVPGLSRTKGQRLIDSDKVTVDGQLRKPAYRVERGDRVTVLLPPARPDRPVQPEPIPLDIVYEDDDLLGVNKPAGMVVHPAPGHLGGTLVNALLAYHPPIAEVGHRSRAGIVHRLDKETSGILVVAKTEGALTALQEQFRNRQVEKLYLGLVQGRVQPPEGIIEVPIGRDPRDRQRMAPLPEGRYARTRYHTAEVLHEHTLLELHPYTGRTHQIRVHLSWFGHPVVGDAVYGRGGTDLLEERHFLHARRLRLRHPARGDELVLEAPLPADLKDVLERLHRSTQRSTPSF